MSHPPPLPLRSDGLHGKTAFAFGAFAASLLAACVLGHDGRRIAQLMALALPAVPLLLWPIRSPALHRLRIGFVWLWAMGFVVDGVVRAFLLETYQAAPGSTFVQSAAANTNHREISEYLLMHWRAMMAWSALLVVAGLIFGRCARHGARVATPWPRWTVAMLSLMLLVGGIAYLSKPWRRLHPVLFWTQWSQSVGALRAGWSDLQKEREAVLARARSAAPIVTQHGPATLVLVIADSINRDNMSLYGYGRATTPQLKAHKDQLKDQMLVMRNAWSVDASTLPSLHNMMKFGEPDAKGPQHVLALARSAGYKVWWMSNHDDIAIEQQHARLADVVEIVNRVPGRAGASLDGELLGGLQEALEDPAERKLIVAHLMGAHPHYSLRFPAGANPFDDKLDDVDEGLARSGRSARVRHFREEYDAALLYHDFVVAETLQLTRSMGRKDEHRAWMYLSDHGQEVGHTSDNAGHSPQTASGYRIPTVIWRSAAPQLQSVETEGRPFRADWAAWTIANLLHLSWKQEHTGRDAVKGDYRWLAPVLPMEVKSFKD